VNEITRFQFEGHALEFQEVDGDLWLNVDEAAEALGYTDRRQVTRLYARHSDEFTKADTCVVNLTPQVGQRRRVRLFSLSGLDALGLLAKTAKGKRLRRWTIDLRARLRDNGDRLAALEAHVRAVESENKALRESLVDDRRHFLGALGEMAASNKAIASLASQIMHERKTQKAIEDEASDSKQLKFWRPWEAGVIPENGDGTVAR
jgi:prophage antirepressor-like protein